MFKLTIKKQTAKQRRKKKRKKRSTSSLLPVPSLVKRSVANPGRHLMKHKLDALSWCRQFTSLVSCNLSQVCIWELPAFIQETRLCLQHKKSFSCILQHGWPALSAGFPHHRENPLTCCTRVRDGWDWVSQCFLQSFMPPCAIEKSDSHTVQCANCGPFAEERSAGYIVLYSWRKFWWYVFFFGLFFAVGSSSSSVSRRFSDIFVFPPEIAPTGNVVTRAVLGQKNYPPLKKINRRVSH